MPHGDGQAVRLTTFVGARFARTAFVPASTTRVVVRRTTRSPIPQTRVQVVSRAVTRPAAVRRLVSLVNRLPGSMTVPFVASCPPAVVRRTVRITFAAADGRWVLAGQDGPCWPQLTLWHGQRRVGPTLEPNGRLVGALGRVLRSTIS